ncbi:MAG: hypothetical protein WAO20_12705 [Acidobacteriota bacterium]
MKRSHLFWGALAVTTAIAFPACTNADSTSPLSVLQVVPAAEIKDVVSAQFAVDGRQLTVTMRSDAAIPAPTGATIHFPAEMFNGFTDGGIKSFLGVAGLYTESAEKGAPLFWTTATQGYFNLPRAAQFSVDSGTLNVTVTGSPLPEIPAGVYTMNFLPGVFKLDAGAHNVSAGITFPGAEVTLNKLLLIRSQVIPHFGVAALPDLGLVTRLVLNNPNGDPNQIRAQFFNQNGDPLDVSVDGNVASEKVFTVPGQGSLQPLLESAGGETSIGWMMLTSQSDRTFRSAVVFSANTPSNDATPASGVSAAHLRTEAGISSSELDTRHVLRVDASQDGLNTAFAIANPTGADAHIRLLLQPDSGDSLTADPLTLPAHNQTARFVTEMFDLPLNSDLEGRLLILSDTDLAVTSLETVNGEAFASLPSGTAGEQ